MHRRLRVAAGLALICVLGACSAAAQAGPAAVDPPPAAEGAAHNDADARFALEMIPHDLQTIEIAGLAQTRSADPFLTRMAAELGAGGNERVGRMTGWLRLWKIPQPAAGVHQGHAMPGMLTPGEIAMLGKASGTTFDRLWLRLAARHLEHGAQMAERVLGSGRHPPTMALAGAIAAAERAELQKIDDRLRR